MTDVALLSLSANLKPLAGRIRERDPSLSLHLWPDPEALNAEVAVCWDPPRQVYERMPRLRLIHSIAAGVDNVVDQQRIGDIPVCRVADPMQARGMLEYVLWGVLHFHRHFDEILRHQSSQHWARPLLKQAASVRVGLMGLGEVGAPVAEGLTRMGYTVSGWARSARQLQGVRCLHGDEGLAPFLAEVDVLVCLLPLTPQTRGILSAQTFGQLPDGAALIHCGRGEHLVEADLQAALASGKLRGALLDVFATEPLPKDHVLWRTPGVVVTPHMATMATFDVVADQITDNIRRLVQGEPLQLRVDLDRGY